MRNSFNGRRAVSQRPSSDIQKIDPFEVFEDFVPDLTTSKNDFAWGCCPFHDDHKPSFCVNTTTGWYRCFSTNCGISGTNIVGFVGELLGLDYRDALRYLEEHYV